MGVYSSLFMLIFLSIQYSYYIVEKSLRHVIINYVNLRGKQISQVGKSVYNYYTILE